ncbi:hypothetical protein [Anoxybacteroides tepidamans]|uniref:hypothetical protein n=1 Tax=Anoxybacteroides tepidamans TaxID=265948 RepID=UPI00068689D9|nr:hypothetical protein [Anoxybacillus tepidamans]
MTHVFYTEEVQRKAEQQLEAHENIRIIKMRVQDCLEKIENNEIHDSELCFAVLHAMLKGYV